MDRMKTFGIYLLIVVVFFIFSNIMINIALKSTYKPMDIYLETQKGEDISIEGSKATYVNGIVQGKLKNNTGIDITDKYIKMDIYTARDNILGTKYIHIPNLKAGQEQDFKMGFKFTNAGICKISIVDTVESDTTDVTLFTSEELGWWAIMKLIVLMLIPV